mmetsp:Transcript_16022/g.32846  ORF Transcript_16022/g.32846 Transcript_16022/m.32846 type:complete len:202 (+) Transcript_16022:1595-2200(+)
MATKTAAQSRVVSAPELTSVITTLETTVLVSTPPSSSPPSTLISAPLISLTVAFQTTLMSGWLRTLSAMVLLALKVSLLCTTVTSFEVRARTRASSIAVSPPPTTTTCSSLNRKPSQVAQELTPPPLNSHSPLTPSHLLSAPVATMTVCVSILVVFVWTSIGLFDVSTLSTSSDWNFVPNWIACSLMLLTTPGPVILARPG